MAEEEKVIGQTVVADGLHRVGKGPTPEWVLVPREPTEAMLGAAWDGTVNWRRLVETADDADMAPLYRAMIAAAPVAEKPDPNPEWEALADEAHASIWAELEPFCMGDALQGGDEGKGEEPEDRDPADDGDDAWFHDSDMGAR